MKMIRVDYITYEGKMMSVDVLDEEGRDTWDIIHDKDSALFKDIFNILSVRCYDG